MASIKNEKKFANNFVINEKLGIGGFSIVKRAVEKSTGFEFAVKMISTMNFSSQQFAELANEVRICRKLQHHPNIVMLHDYIQGPLTHYLVFELMPGGELLDDIVSREFYSEVDASHCMHQILQAVHFCHRNGIVHRDIKPENLLLASKAKGTVVKLADFGISVEVQGDQPIVHGFCGTRSYVSPEVILIKPHGKPVDIWACGVIMYLLLVGNQPSESMLFPQLEVSDDSEEWSMLSPEARSLIKKMLVFEPSDRITASEALNHPWICHREHVASMLHKQDTIKCMQMFNIRRKLKGVFVATRLAISNLNAKLMCKKNKDEAVKIKTDSNVALEVEESEKGKEGIDSEGASLSDDKDNEKIMSNETKDESQSPVNLKTDSNVALKDDKQDIDRGRVDFLSDCKDEVELLQANGDNNAFLRRMEIIQFTDALVSAANNGDYDTYSKLCDPDVSAFDPYISTKLVEGVKFHKFFIDNTPTQVKRNTTILNPKVHLLADDIAVIAYECITKTVDAEGRRATQLSQETRVWHKRHNKWTVVHFHRS